jgi:hypothetical protein
LISEILNKLLILILIKLILNKLERDGIELEKL